MQMPPRLRWPKFRASQDSSASAATLAWPASPSATGHPWEHHCSFAPFWKTRSELHRSFVHLSRLLRRRDTSAGVNVPLEPVVIEGTACFRTLVLLLGLSTLPPTSLTALPCAALPCAAFLHSTNRDLRPLCLLSSDSLEEILSRFFSVSHGQASQEKTANACHRVFGIRPRHSYARPSVRPRPRATRLLCMRTPPRLRILWHADETKFCTPMRRTSSVL